MTTKLTSEEAAREVIALFNTPVLSKANEALEETGSIGRWLDEALTARSRMSTGEEILLNVVLFVYNRGGAATLHDLTALDAKLMAKVLAIITERYVGA